jgi:hypothetical protein
LRFPGTGGLYSAGRRYDATDGAGVGEFDLSQPSIADICLLNLQFLDKLLPQVLTEPKYAISCNHPIRPTRLIPPGAIHKLTLPINLQAAEDVLWPRDSPVVRYIALIRDVNPATPSPRAHAALVTGSTTRRTALLCPVYHAQAAASRERHCLGLGDDFGIIVRMLGNDGLQDIGEPWVFLERVWSWRDSGACAESDLTSRRIGREEGEDVSAEGFLVGKDVLSSVSNVRIDEDGGGSQSTMWGLLSSVESALLDTRRVECRRARPAVRDSIVAALTCKQGEWEGRWTLPGSNWIILEAYTIKVSCSTSSRINSDVNITGLGKVPKR